MKANPYMVAMSALWVAAALLSAFIAWLAVIPWGYGLMALMATKLAYDIWQVRDCRSRDEVVARRKELGRG